MVVLNVTLYLAGKWVI